MYLKLFKVANDSNKLLNVELIIVNIIRYIYFIFNFV